MAQAWTAGGQGMIMETEEPAGVEREMFILQASRTKRGGDTAEIIMIQDIHLPTEAFPSIDGFLKHHHSHPLFIRKSRFSIAMVAFMNIIGPRAAPPFPYMNVMRVLA